MQVAISGSSGLIGSALVRELLSAGHSVLRLARATSGPQSDVPQIPGSEPGVTHWDPATGLSHPEQLNGMDAVFHLAGKSIASGRWTEKVKKEIRDSRVAPTLVLAKQIVTLDSPPPVFISASAVGIYGDCGAEVVTEAHSQGNGFLAEVAGSWEAACDPLREAGMRVIHPRLGIVLSYKGGALNKMLPLFRWMLGGKLGNGRQYWSWISLPDCIRSLVWLLEQHHASGPYNLVAPNPETNAEFTRHLAHALHRPTSLPVPACALRLAMGEMADALLLSSCRATPNRLLESGFQFRYPQLAKFLVHELEGSQSPIES